MSVKNSATIEKIVFFFAVFFSTIACKIKNNTAATTPIPI